MNLSLKQLEAFIWVSDLGSFRRAAERLNTTQPNISSHISSLESVLKVTLMERDAGSVRLTTKGQDLLVHARKVLRSVEHLVEASDRASLLDGVLNLGVTEMIAHTWLRDFLKVLKGRFPNVAVELTIDLSVNLERGLLERSIDLALQSEPFRHQTTGNEDLGTYPLIWVGAPALDLCGHGPLGIEQLADQTILTHARDTRSYQEIVSHFARRRDLQARLVPSSSLSACLHMTVDGMGISAVPEAMVLDEVTSGRLVRIDYGWTPDPLHFLARYDKERTPQFVAKAASLANDVAAGFKRRLAD